MKRRKKTAKITWQDHRQNCIRDKINTQQKWKRPSRQAKKTFISEYCLLSLINNIIYIAVSSCKELCACDCLILSLFQIGQMYLIGVWVALKIKPFPSAVQAHLFDQSEAFHKLAYTIYALICLGKSTDGY